MTATAFTEVSITPAYCRPSRSWVRCHLCGWSVVETRQVAEYAGAQHRCGEGSSE